MGKFEKIDDASKHIDDQLILAGFLNSNQSLQLSETTNGKLIINTVHRLLISLDDKNKQLEAAHDKIEELKKAPKLVEVKGDQGDQGEPRPQFTRTVQPVRLKRSRSHNDNTRVRIFRVKLNRLQTIIDELKWQLNSERNRSRNSLGPDITWTVQESIERKQESASSPLEIIDQYRDEITQLKIQLEKALHDKRMIIEHLAHVNRYAYSTGVLDIHPVNKVVEEEKWRNWLGELDKDDLELKELVQDWYEIVEISMKTRE